MKTTTKSAIAAIRRQLGVARLDPRRLYLVYDGAYHWIGDRADLTAAIARRLRNVHDCGTRPDLHQSEVDADQYTADCGAVACIASSCGSGLLGMDDLPESWRDGSALGPIAPL